MAESKNLLSRFQDGIRNVAAAAWGSVAAVARIIPDPEKILKDLDDSLMDAKNNYEKNKLIKKSISSIITWVEKNPLSDFRTNYSDQGYNSYRDLMTDLQKKFDDHRPQDTIISYINNNPKIQKAHPKGINAIRFFSETDHAQWDAKVAEYHNNVQKFYAMKRHEEKVKRIEIEVESDVASITLAADSPDVDIRQASEDLKRIFKIVDSNDTQDMRDTLLPLNNYPSPDKMTHEERISWLNVCLNAEYGR